MKCGNCGKEVEEICSDCKRCKDCGDEFCRNHMKRIVNNSFFGSKQLLNKQANK